MNIGFRHNVCQTKRHKVIFPSYQKALNQMLKRIWRMLGSVRIVVPLLIVISLVSLVGIAVPQGSPAMEFHETGWCASLMLRLGLNHLFSTGWFYALLGLLSVNVVACSSSRQLSNVRKAMTPHFLRSAEDIRPFKWSMEFSNTRPPSEAAGLLSGFFKRRLYFSATLNQGNNIQVASHSFCFREIGSLLFHMSILFFFAGSLMGNLRGWSFVKKFHEDEISAIRGWNCLVRCDWFKIEKNDNGTISDYKTKLTVLSPDSTPVFSKVIEVNHPLSYKGLRFYQYSYGEQYGAIEDTDLNMSGPGIDSALNNAPRYFTGIKISRNPGAVFIWLGFALMTIGIMPAFYFPHKSFWIFIEPGEACLSRIVVGGFSDRPVSAFQKEFKRTCSFLRSLLKEG
jgi:cytochrome c biogenesis protein ResB